MTLAFIPEGSGPSGVTPGLLSYNFQSTVLTGLSNSKKALRNLLYLDLHAEQLSSLPWLTRITHQPGLIRPSLPAESEARGALKGWGEVLISGPWKRCVSLLEALLPLE